MFNRNKKRPSAVARKQSNPQLKSRGLKVAGFISVTLVIAGIAYGLSFVNQLTLFPIKQVKIEGEFRFINEQMVRQQLSSEVINGFFDINLDSIRHSLLEISWVEDAFIRRDWPDSLVIRVVEKQPVARWNKNYLISSKGDVFKPDQQVDKNALEVAMLQGPEDRHDFVFSEYNHIQALLRTVGLEVTKLKLDDRRAWTVSMNNNIDVLLGRNNAFERLTRFVQIYNAVILPKLNTVQRVDFRYTNGFAIVWKQDQTSMSAVIKTTLLEFDHFTNPGVWKRDQVSGASYYV